ncbi:patatin-like phospholipase family protein [Paenactinomyces guangxiensis]|uniref:Patatin-like phospholipase family protein n=1 Tax=Paenactinomyces guangxiensis TaxID=1490290 RepID=A0A7W1WRQ5_9BACL|nr:patatin-like phospholipase family protein [Paenactinomyces guangxiensis]MBA4494743.1 patatin-like phospholipase family protein [Paenactinomyces guangxiensis]MBH8591827.1 patatin-like phospholipase family protein [Paenactinomyces guangxiensis]
MARPKIGLALSSGAARGMAHFGVLKVLQQEGIPIDFIAGSSMGSIVGVLYANGLDLEMCEKLAIRLKRKHWLDLTVPKRGFVIGDRVKALIRLLTHQKSLEELQIPTAVVATDLSNGERVVFKSGPIDEAVRASISIPGIFEPVIVGDRILVDGGVIDRVPVSVVREMGADLVIAVDVLPRIDRVKINNIFDVITQTLVIMEREILQQRMTTADFIIQPDVSDINPTAFTRVEECIRRGEEEARSHIQQLKKLIQERQGEEAMNELQKME